MLGSPVEVRYGDGDAVVLIQTDPGDARSSDGNCGVAETPQNTPHNQGNVVGGPESSRIIIRDTHGKEGCGSITIVTPTNNLKISINTKRYDRQNGFQAAKRILASDLRNKLGELDELLKACDDDEDIQRGKSLDDRRPTTVTVQSQPTDSVNNITAASHGTTASGMESSTNVPGACSLHYLQEHLSLYEDVLVRITNDNELFYLGTVIDLEPNHGCLVRFEDATKRRFAHTSITRCSRSQRLLECSSTLDPVEFSDPRPQQQPVQQSIEHDAERSSPTRTIRFPPEFSSLVCITQLPYDLKTLQWDANHRVNKTGNYCYCGNDGDWTREMMQCRRCEQWFHGRCIRSLQFPIFHGDTFYVFICSICNHGHEFVRRLVLSAVNLVHLVLYNLIMRNGLRFYGLRTAIIPYIEDNQRTLQLSDQFMKLSTQERTDLVMQTLKNNKDRFLNGKEFTLSPQLWTLRQPVPPAAESITIPIATAEIVTESILQQKLDVTEHFRFLPRVYHEKNYFMDGATRERMLGLGYANHPESIADPRIESVIDASAQSATANMQLQSTSNCSASASPLPQTNGSNGLVGARRRKRCGIRPTPVTKPMPYDGLGALIPLPANFNGPNHPFYEEESSSASSGNYKARYHCRKIGSMKRRAFEMNQRYMSNAKRRKLGHSGAS
uniref:Zinc finger PHD-type domain-containing protein n=1 Tax=Anopheles maculatus TaxID=74869 RepID=A0A182T645_9DIPT